MVLNNENPPADAKKPGFRQNALFCYAALTMLGVVTGLLALLFGAAYYGLPLFAGYFSSPAVILLNLLPPVLLILLVYFITGRAVVGYALPSLVFLLLAAVNFFKLQIRGDPLVAADLLLIGETGHIIFSFGLTLNWKIFLTVSVFLLCVLCCVFLLRHTEKRPVVRITGSAAVAAVSALLYVFIYANTDIYLETRGGFEPSGLSYTENYIARGFVYPFIHSIKDAFPEAPDGYSMEDSLNLLRAYTDPGIPDDKKVNIISIMLESYMDFSRFDILKIDESVYSPLHKLQGESVSGELIVNVFGGGTIDTERSFLTGFTQLINYSAPTNSYVHYLNRQGYYTEGFHTGDSWFYDRNTVNKYLGFQNYYFLEDFDDSSRWDSFFFPKVKELYDGRDKEKPYFAYNLSYQNHGAYDGTVTQAPYLILPDGLSDESFCILNNYLTGIQDTTARVAELIDSLRTDDQAVVVVVFGDHMPWLGNYEAVYKELGINVDAGTEEGFYNYYSTPYLIWANDAAKKQLDNDFTGDGGSFSPCFLMDKVFSLCSWTGESFMQALREFGQDVDIISTTAGVFRENGKLTLTLSGESERMWQTLRKLEYFRFFNFLH